MDKDLPENSDFENFYEQTAHCAGSYVRCLCRNAAETDDIVQDGFVKAMRQWNSYSGRSTRKAWLFGILRNTYLSWNRRRKVRAVISLHLAGEIPDRRTDLDDRQLWQAVETLEKHHREILYLRFAGNLSYSEIAGVLNIPDGTVRSRLYRALKELKERLT